MSFRIPKATYRLQFNRHFTFQQATAIADYLNELGISDCYASPLFKATEHSTHGYDTCNFEQLNPNLGTPEDFERFTALLRELQMGLLLDMVPNHMAADISNPWWWDVLEKGRHSVYSSWFDIDWKRQGINGKVLLPVLEAPYAQVLESGKLRLCFESSSAKQALNRTTRKGTFPGRFVLAYYDRIFPLSAVSSARLFSCLEEHAELPGRGIQVLLEDYNGKPGKPDSFDKLDSLLKEQHYRLAHWKVAHHELNYRRFFDVTELISLRMELPKVFEATHRLLLRLIREGAVTGLRVDHPDGLWNPKQYFERLQQCCSMQAAGTPKNRQCYIVAEKILMAGEELPQDWPIAGTTGYEFLNCLNGLFVAAENEDVLSRVYKEFAGCNKTFTEIVRSAKERVLESALCSELRALANRLKEIASRSRYGQDFTFKQLEEGLRQLIACFPVYRTYITEETIEPKKHEKNFIRKAAKDAAELAASQTKPVLEFIANLLLLEYPAGMDVNDRQLAQDFVMRFQQLTGPVMAKGMEDTAFYVFNRLVSLNEVGGAPERFGTDVETFHEFNLRRNQTCPHSLLATATHDTKRGEDVRARINVLSEMPEEWKGAVQRWQRLNSQHKTVLAGKPAPSSNDEYLLYQVLVGAWPSEPEAAFAERIKAYMQKATREAKSHTNWTEPNAAYEAATTAFIDKILSDEASSEFLGEFKAFQRKVAFFGQFNALSQILLKITSPGVPDVYQGTELWDLSLVDPDNRRPVDYELRRQQLNGLKKEWEQAHKPAKALLTELLEEKRRGMMKLFVTWRALNFRQEHSGLFNRGAYTPLTARGKKRQHVCAFARRLEEEEVLVVAPRLLKTLAEGAEQPPLGELWQDTVLELPTKATARYQNVITGETIKAAHGGLALGEVFGLFPVALLKVAG